MSLFFSEGAQAPEALPINDSMRQAVESLVTEGLGQTMADALFAQDTGEAQLGARAAERSTFVECRRQANLKISFALRQGFNPSRRVRKGIRIVAG